jgi:hypothetical protein
MALSDLVGANRPKCGPPRLGCLAGLCAPSVYVIGRRPRPPEMVSQRSNAGRVTSQKDEQDDDASRCHGLVERRLSEKRMTKDIVG